MKLVAVIVFASVAIAAFGGQTEGSTDHELAIYLVEDGLEYRTYLSGVDLSALTLSEAPLVTLNDFEQYEWSSHNITLSKACVSRLEHEFDVGLRKSINFKAFVVTARGERIYLGVLIALTSSYIPADVPMIGIPLGRWRGQDMGIGRGGGESDVRNSAQIRSVLEEAGLIGGE